MSLLLLLAVLLDAVVVLFFSDRLNPWVSMVGGATAIIALVILGIAGPDVRPFIVATAIALTMFGIRFPLLTGGGRRRDALPRGYRKFAEPARYLRGRLVAEWPLGELELDDRSIRFVTSAGSELFSIPVSKIDGLDSKTRGREISRSESAAKVTRSHSVMRSWTVTTSQPRFGSGCPQSASGKASRMA